MDDLAMFKLQRLLVADEELTREVIDFNELTGNSLNPAPFDVLGESVSIEIAAGWTDNDFDCGTGDVLVFDTDVASTVDGDLVASGQSVVPNLGNVLSHQSCETDGDTNTNPTFPDPAVDPGFIPNDADVMFTMEFSFPTITGGWVIENYTALDQETEEFIAVDADGSEVGITGANVGGDGGLEIVDITVDGSFSSTLDFRFDGSGAIDDIQVCRMVERGGEGCTPGYWKQSQHFDSWPGGDTSIRFDEAFSEACTIGADLRRPESGSGQRRGLPA